MIRFNPPLTRIEWLLAITVAIPVFVLGYYAGKALFP